MTASDNEIEERIERLHAHGLVDLHFDLPMDLYEKRGRQNVLATDFLPDFEAGNIGVIGAAHLHRRSLPSGNGDCAWRWIRSRGSTPRSDQSDRFAICKSYQEILRARAAGKIALLITMEGVEPLGRTWIFSASFLSLGLRVIGLTHVRRNAAGDRAAFSRRAVPRAMG